MDDIQWVLQIAHNAVRWFILSLAVVGAARSFVSMLSVSARYTRLDQGLNNAYRGALTLQVVIGVLLALAATVLQIAVPWVHVLIMLPAVALAHLSRRFRDQPERRRHQAQLAIYLGSLALVLIGLAVIGKLALPL